MHELEEGIMRVIAGPEKKTRVMSEKERLVTAFHEMGHAIVGHLLPNCDPVHKVSIIGRGQALGYTISLPGEDKFLTTRAELSDTMAMTLGGRAAEEIVFGEITTGASNDLEKVTETAKQMVMRYGMSERLGPRVFGHDRSMPFLGREFSSEPDYSDEIAREIDDEIRRIVEEAHQTAKDLLVEHREDLDRISNLLLERETIDAEQFVKLLEGASAEEVFGSRGRRARAAGAEPGAGAQRRPRGPAPGAAPASRLRRRLGRDARRPARLSRDYFGRNCTQGALRPVRCLRHHRPEPLRCQAKRAAGPRVGLVAAIAAVLCLGVAAAVANNLDRRTATNYAKSMARDECRSTTGLQAVLRPRPAPGQPAQGGRQDRGRRRASGVQLRVRRGSS